MKVEIMLAMHSALKRDYSEKNQLKQLELLRAILEINQEVFVHGIGRIEDYERNMKKYPLFCSGLKLVRAGVEPQVVESVLLNAAIANEGDLLESLLVVDGVLSIQVLRSPDVTKEILLAYFGFDLQERLREGVVDLRLNGGRPLDKGELMDLLKN